jgi:hypothetical protein
MNAIIHNSSKRLFEIGKVLLATGNAFIGDHPIGLLTAFAV